MGCCCVKAERTDTGDIIQEHISSNNVIINNFEEDDHIFHHSNPIVPINKYVLETLSVMRSLVDNDQEPPLSMSKLHAIADQEYGWLLVVRSMAQIIPLEDPLGPALIVLLLDDCPLPRKETVIGLSDFFDTKWDFPESIWREPRVHRNICVILGCIAEKLAGPASVALLSTATLGYLLSQLAETNHPCIVLFAVIALEKFAQTAENKTTIMSQLLESGDGLSNNFSALETWIMSDDLVKKQVGFCAQWCLDNLFIFEDRPYSYKCVDTSNLNAILNNDDVTEYLKISPNGLQARCDASSFESVRCTFQVDLGIWFYEVLVVTTGVMQIGWATKNSKFLNHEGFGIGDDEFSVAYDGCRQLIWHRAESTKHDHPCWKAGDILGLLLDIDGCRLIFYLNGNPLHSDIKLFQYAKRGFFAAASFMSFQQCEFNFGNKPFSFPPKDIPIKSFNEVAQLDAKKRTILPRHIRLELMRAASVEEGSCTLCFDRKATITHLPCDHTGFCLTCSLILERCPMCRQHITDRRDLGQDIVSISPPSSMVDVT